MENADHGAESDTFRDSIANYNTLITKDVVEGDKTVIEYINGEGDPPFVKYRYTLEAINEVSAEEFTALNAEQNTSEATAEEAANLSSN